MQRLHGKPQFLQREGEALPADLIQTVRALLEKRDANGGITTWHVGAS